MRNIENIKNASLEDINSIYDIGPVVAQSIFEYFHEEKNIDLINRLIENGIELKSPKKIESKEEKDRLKRLVQSILWLKMLGLWIWSSMDLIVITV